MSPSRRLILLVLGAAVLAGAAFFWAGRTQEGTSSRSSGPEPGFSSTTVGTSALSHGGPAPARRDGTPPREGAGQDGGGRTGRP